jgi:hypothetical protein
MKAAAVAMRLQNIVVTPSVSADAVLNRRGNRPYGVRVC